MTHAEQAETLANLDKSIEDTDPRMIATLDILTGIREALEEGSANVETFIILVTGAVASIERRLVQLQAKVAEES